MNSLERGSLKAVLAYGKVYGCFLDASNHVDHAILFEKLLHRNLPSAAIVRRLQLKVRWCNEHSDSFSISNGVHQGGVLSLILFTIYLLTALEKNDVGCLWKHHDYVGAVC